MTMAAATFPLRLLCRNFGLRYWTDPLTFQRVTKWYLLLGMTCLPLFFAAPILTRASGSPRGFTGVDGTGTSPLRIA